MNFKPVATLLDFFYPPHCLVCEKMGAIIHPQCRAELPFILEPFCTYCGLPLAAPGSRCSSTLCLRPPAARSLTGVRSVFRHSKGAREGILKLKYKGVSSLTDWLVNELSAATERYQLENVAGIVPVPLHPKRLTARGYNQAGLLAQGLAKRVNLPLYETNLLRSRETRSQVGLDRSGRAENVRGAFSWQGSPLEGANLLLLDDVCTTGATLSECAKTLKLAGADSVWGLTVTREVRQDS